MLTNNVSKSINATLILARNYIFSCARKKNTIQFDIFLFKLKSFYTEQKALSRLNDKEFIFDRIWERFHTVLQL